MEKLFGLTYIGALFALGVGIWAAIVAYRTRRRLERKGGEDKSD